MLTVLIDVDTLSQLQINPALARRPKPDAYREEAKFARVETTETSRVEIVIGEVVVRVSSDIDPDHLTMILRAVRKA